MPHARRAAPSTPKNNPTVYSAAGMCVPPPRRRLIPPPAVNPRNLRSAAKSGMTGKWKGRFEMSTGQRLYLATEVYLERRRPVPLLRDRWHVEVTQDPSGFAVQTRLGPLPQWRQAVVLLRSTEGLAGDSLEFIHLQ